MVKCQAFLVDTSKHAQAPPTRQAGTTLSLTPERLSVTSAPTQANISDGNTTAGILSDLQKWDEAGRDRILNLLSPENMKDIIKACLRERESTSSELESSSFKLKLSHNKQTELRRSISRTEWGIVEPRNRSTSRMPLR